MSMSIRKLEAKMWKITLLCLTILKVIQPFARRSRVHLHPYIPLYFQRAHLFICKLIYKLFI